MHELFENLQKRITEEISKQLVEAETRSSDPPQRSATWTYLTTDEPFGGFGVEMRKGKNIGYSAAMLVYGPFSLLGLILTRLWRRERKS